MRWIYLSPHLDDVVLSAGGLVWEQTWAAEAVEVWTVFAGDPPPPPYTPFAAELHARWGAQGSTAAAVRREEDRAACQVLSAQVRHADLPDCIYRRLPTSQQPVIRERDDLFRPYPPEEDYLVTQIAAWIRGSGALNANETPTPNPSTWAPCPGAGPKRGGEQEKMGSFGSETLPKLPNPLDLLPLPFREGGRGVRSELIYNTPPSGKGLRQGMVPRWAGGLGSPETRLVSPLALGGHIDHRLVRAAAESLNIPLWFYPDYPYAVEDPLNHTDLRSEIAAYQPALVQALSPQAVASWQSAIAANTSQISTFWGSLDEMRARIAAYHVEGGGCTLYQKPG